MTQHELIKLVAELSGTTQAKTDLLIWVLGAVVIDQLLVGDSVEHRGLGRFSVTDRAARKCRNPHTGAEIEIAATRKVKFKAAKVLTDRLNPAGERRLIRPIEPSSDHLHLIERAVRFCRPRVGQCRWSVVMSVFGIGSTAARTLCLEFGFDPDETLSPTGQRDPRTHAEEETR